MHYTRIDVEGTNGRYAVLTRRRESEYIDVKMHLPLLVRTHHVQADDPVDLESMAECLQQTLDGHRGTRGDIRSYSMPLELLAD